MLIINCILFYISELPEGNLCRTSLYSTCPILPHYTALRTIHIYYLSSISKLENMKNNHIVQDPVSSFLQSLQSNLFLTEKSL